MWTDAIGQFNAAVGSSENYAEAWREKEIADKLAFDYKLNSVPQANPAPGEADLRRAIELNVRDSTRMPSWRCPQARGPIRRGVAQL